MRVIWVLVVVGACKKDEPAAPPPPPPKPAVTPDAAPVALVDLGKRVALEIMVSSQVDNPAILPAHLVDRDPNTAWNSRTNELEGAWIDVDAPVGATIAELRFTVGHTGHGPKGEDYFTMNPRIAKVEVTSAIDAEHAVVLGEYKLDIANRGMQTVAFEPHRQVRLRVVDIVPGSQKKWRETCVGELEAWGTPPAGAAVPAKALTPAVTVYQPPPKDPAPCADLEERLEERAKQLHEFVVNCNQYEGKERQNCAADPPGSPTCRTITQDLPAFGDWPREVDVTCDTPDDVYGHMTCTIARGKVVMVELIGEHTLQIDKVEPALRGGMLALRIATSGDKFDEYLALCTKTRCGDPIPVAREDWRLKVTVANALYSTTVEKGAPPADLIVANKPLF